MELNGYLCVFLGGMAGPVVLELVKITAWHDLNKMKSKYRKPVYWISFLALLLVSGFVVVLNGIDHVELAKAVELGINAPAIVAGYATASASGKNNHANAMAGRETVADILSW